MVLLDWGGGWWWWLYRPRRTAGLYPLPRRRRCSPPFLYPLTPFYLYLSLTPSRRHDTHTDERMVLFPSLSFLPRVVASPCAPQSVSNPLASGSPKTSKGWIFHFPPFGVEFRIDACSPWISRSINTHRWPAVV